MLDCSPIKYSLKLINKHIKHVFYLQFTMNVFQIYFLNVTMKKFFTLLSILGAHFFLYLIDVLEVHGRCTLTSMYLIFEALPPS